MLNFHKEAEAQEKLECPLARTFGFEAGELSEHCRGSSCAFWRWRPLMANDPGYKEAVAAAKQMPKQELGEMIPPFSSTRTAPSLTCPKSPFLATAALAGNR